MTQNRKRILKNYKKQQGLCHWCYLPMLLTGKRWKGSRKCLKATVDHLSPRNGERREYVLAHYTCNCERQHAKDISLETIKKIGRVVKNEFKDLIIEWKRNLNK